MARVTEHGIEGRERTVIYIMGTGRSGSTLLDVMLGNARDVFSCGELRHHADHRGVIDDQIHVRPQAVAFWREVLANLEHKYGGKLDFNRLEGLIKKYDYHSAVLRRHARNGPADWHAYQDYLLKLYSAVFESINEHCIVDSSKYQLRALNLIEALPYQFRFIYLKRDPVGVVRSLQKTIEGEKGKGWCAANLYYFGVNLHCRQIYRQLGKKYPVVMLRYEDLVRDPARSLKKIEDALGIDLSVPIERAAKGEYFDVGYALAGSRFLHSGNPERIQVAAPRERRKRTMADALTLLLNGWLYR
jgi:hypothetical protein